MARSWKPRDIVLIMGACTGCLCLATVVIGGVAGLLLGKLSGEAVGSLQGAAASGLIAFALIAFWVIRLALKAGDDK